MNNNEMFRIMSDSLQEAYKQGDWISASEILQGLEREYIGEERYTDAMKVLMLAFYFDISGIILQPFVDERLVDEVRSVYAKTDMNFDELKELYFDTIRDNTLPKHSLTVKGSFRVFVYCLLRKQRKIDQVLNNLVN